MAEWIEEKIDKTQINKGQQYNNGDGLSAEDLNAIVKGLLYAQEKTSDSQYVRIDDDIDNSDKFIDYLNNYNINLTDFKNQTVCFESYSETYYYDYFVFLTNYDNEAILLCDGGVFNISYSINGYKKYNIVQKVTGDLANLQNGIMDKDNLVSAINYTYEATLFNSRNIDTINKEKGNLFDLQTNDKTNLVNAINEIKNSGGGSSSGGDTQHLYRHYYIIKNDNGYVMMQVYTTDPNSITDVTTFYTTYCPVAGRTPYFGFIKDGSSLRTGTIYVNRGGNWGTSLSIFDGNSVAYWTPKQIVSDTVTQVF